MQSLILNQPGTKVSIQNNQIKIHTPEGDHNYPIKQIKGITTFGPIHFSGQALMRLMENGIFIQFYDGKCQPKGQLVNESAAHQHKPLQWHYHQHEELKNTAAKTILWAKLHNQHRQQQRWQKSHPHIQLNPNHMQHLKRLANGSKPSDLMGYEGGAAKAHFSIMADITKDTKLPFEKRSKHPPENEFNALLSFGYTILYNQNVKALYQHHLAPYLGFLHSTQQRAHNLALDLMEPLRPLVDSWVVRIAEKFEEEEFQKHNPGTYLTYEGRKHLLKLMAEWLEKRYTHQDQKMTLEGIIEWQIQQYIRAVKEQTPYSAQHLYLMS
jgi:CRISPR-associated protein Cas1